MALDVAPPAPDKESAAAAVAALQAELELADGNLDSVDRKAALVPPVLAGLVGVFAIPEWDRVSALQAGLLLLAAIAGFVSVFLALKVLEGRALVIGPEADKVVKDFISTSKTSIAHSPVLSQSRSIT